MPSRKFLQPVTQSVGVSFDCRACQIARQIFDQVSGGLIPVSDILVQRLERNPIQTAFESFAELRGSG